MKTVLIANRGEIALRIIRACRQRGLRAVTICSEADRDALWTRAADDCLCIGGSSARDSYLDMRRLLLAAEALGADAIHPGYGFLSENAAFAGMVEQMGLVFIGPTPANIELMGNKITAKAAMARAGVPCVPGSDGALPDDADTCRAIAAAVGYPVLLKAAAGGGGRGMRVVWEDKDLMAALRLTGEEARSAFGNGAIYLERYLEQPRHIEIQVARDLHGNAVWLGERDCSIQRRHQKLIEEGPAVGVDRALIADVGARCVRACHETEYRGVGTFEFLYENGTFAFIEMNTRIQVEHPVTEALTGIDLVALQLAIAAGEPLGFSQDDIALTGHAIECRINAEDAVRGVASPGVIESWISPGGPGVRVDSAMEAGARVPPFYDSLIAKIITHAPDRAGALARMEGALRMLRVEGIQTNRELHGQILADDAFRKGGVSIHFLENRLK